MRKVKRGKCWWLTPMAEWKKIQCLQGMTGQGELGKKGRLSREQETGIDGRCSTSCASGLSGQNTVWCVALSYANNVRGIYTNINQRGKKERAVFW